MIIGDIIRRNASLYGDQIGLVFEGRRFTHREFARRTYRAANALLALGIRPQERVAMLARNCSEVLEVFGAGEVAGFVTVNLNHRLSVPEIVDICTDAQPSVFVFEPDFAEAASALRERVPSIRHYICIGGTVAGAADYETALASASDAEPAVRASPDDIAYLIYTSGTTGRPKGVVWRHRAMVEAVRTLTLEGSALEPVTALIVMPLFHIGARIELLSFLLLGGAIRAAPRLRCGCRTGNHRARTHHRDFIVHRSWSSACSKCQTAPHSIPRHCNMCVMRRRRCRCPCSKRALEAFGPIFGQVYGMTEWRLGGTTLKPHDHVVDGSEKAMRRLASAGRPYLGTDVRIVRIDGAAMPRRGETGEILLRSPATMSGYWNNHAATTAALRDGWFQYAGPWPCR